MTDTIVYQGRAAGLGVIITQLSFLLYTQRPVELWVPNADNLAVAIKRIWQIPDHQLNIKIGVNTDAISNLESDELCAYAPYFYSQHLELMGRRIPANTQRKKHVAVCMHHGKGLREDITVREMPYNKFATAEEYEKLFTLIDRAGYDIITMNSADTDLEHKTYLLNEHCDVVIGYEGGLHHLAHLLKIPSIILPWRFCDNGDPPIPPGIYYEPHRYHPDRRTWFVMGDVGQHLLSWTPDQLKQKIDDLYQDRGNNILFDSLTVFDQNTLRIQHPRRDLTPRLHPFEFDLVRQLATRFDVFKSG